MAAQASPATPATLGHPHDLGAPPVAVCRHARPVRPPERDRDHCGLPPTPDGRAPQRAGSDGSILGYLEDGPNLFTLAMNGWADPEPAWWLNLQAHPDARVDLAMVPARPRERADNEERARLWARLGGGPWGDLDGFAARRTRETPVVILEPRD